MEEVKHIKLRKNQKVTELLKEMEASGVMGAGRIARAAEILKKMVHNKECKIFFGVAGAMVPGGMKNILIDFLKKGYVDVFVTTGANLTHDLVEALNFKHYKGSPSVNDYELYKKGIDRIYDSFMPNKAYEKLEDFFDKNFELIKNSEDITEFLWAIGKLLKEKNSILGVCYRKKIPIFCPGIADSGIGLMVWGRIVQGKNIKVNAFEDLKRIMEISWQAKKKGVIYVGGGVPKNYIQQAMQLTGGADYGIQITTDRPEYGGSSGASLKEGISWGKLKRNAEFVDVVCDATIALPLIFSVLY